jgi:hypothetical protein
MHWVQVGQWEFRLEDVRAVYLGTSSAASLRLHLDGVAAFDLTPDDAGRFAALWDDYIRETGVDTRPSPLMKRLFPDA